jgi:ubiquinone/menaquinone biosynthesis C-methylase UbiE
MADDLEPVMLKFFDSAGNKYASHDLPHIVAHAAIQHLPPFTSSSVLLDNATGPATVTSAILAQCAVNKSQPPQIYATDISEGMINIVRARIQSNNWQTVKAEVMDGRELSGFKDEYFTHSITSLGVMVTGAKAIYRTLQKGGTAVATTWNRQPLVDFANKIKDVIHPGLPSFPPGYSSEWWSEEFLPKTMKDAGFTNSKIDIVKWSSTFANVDELLEELRSDFYMMARIGMTDDEKRKWDNVVREEIEKRRNLKFDFEVDCATATK